MSGLGGGSLGGGGMGIGMGREGRGRWRLFVSLGLRLEGVGLMGGWVQACLRASRGWGCGWGVVLLWVMNVDVEV